MTLEAICALVSILLTVGGFGWRAVVWLARIYVEVKNGIKELRILRGDHQKLETRVQHTETAVEQHKKRLGRIEQQLGHA